MTNETAKTIAPMPTIPAPMSTGVDFIREGGESRCPQLPQYGSLVSRRVPQLEQYTTKLSQTLF